MKENENLDWGKVEDVFNKDKVQDNFLRGNNNYLCSYGLLQNGKAKNLANALKQLVKYDRDLFDIFSKVKIPNKPDDMQQISGNFTSLLNEENDGDLEVKEPDQSNAPKIVKKNTSTVEEKIDYIMGNYEKNSVLADAQMCSDTGYSFRLIFALVSEIAKGENNFECELGTVSVFRSMKTKEKLTPEHREKIKKISLSFADSVIGLFAFEKNRIFCFVLTSQEVLAQLRERVQNYETAKKDLEKLFDDTLAQIKKVLGIPNESNKDNLNLNLDIKKDKDKQFAIRRTFWGYMGSFLKNILLDLTLINPIRKIFFLNKIKGQIQSLKTEFEKTIKQPTEEVNQSKPKDLVELEEGIGEGEQSTEIIEKTFNNVLERISKKNKLWSLILDAVATITPSVLFACSLIFAWGSILNYIFLAALLASIVYKGIKQYRQERRKYLATKASQYLNKPPQNFIYDLFDQIQQFMNMQKQSVLSLINLQIEQLENHIRQIEQKNNIDNEKKPKEEIKKEKTK